MPSPEISTGTLRRKKKACRRCRHRKQRCDFEQPCHNCAAAGVECLAVIPESYQTYPAGYVSALENHAAMLERSLNEQQSGTARDHLQSMSSQPLDLALDGEASMNMMANSFNSFTTFPFGTSPDEERMWGWQPPHASGLIASGMNIPLPSMAMDHSHSSPLEFDTQLDMQVPQLPDNPPIQKPSTRPEGIDDIPTATAASFFRTYFQFIHPQYPFLNELDCIEWYNEWKLAPASKPINGWPAFFVKMIFAIGSLVQSKSDHAPRYQHQDLKSQAQSEVAIIQNTKSSPLIRLQAMLLSAMHALHSDSTARISHISGAIIKFASAHGFHRLVDLRDEESNLKIRVWSSAYALDRGTSATLDIPVSLPDVYISSPLYTNIVEESTPMPWLKDISPTETQQAPPTLGPFAHICNIRLSQSYIMHTLHSIDVHGGVSPQWQESMILQIDRWSDEITSHAFVTNEGYQSPLWLGLISHLSRLVLCRPSKSNISSVVSDVALQAGCDACTTFRALKKKRQVAQPWLVVLTLFQSGVTILYIIWARGIQVSKQADIAIRDCTSVLAILADRWQNAEQYRDCFEILARSICRNLGPAGLEDEDREELRELVELVNESGVHRHVSTMLYEMVSGNGEGGMEY